MMTLNERMTVEICVGDVESAIAAEAGGADRVELCDNLAVGGTTPSAGTIAEACRRLRIPVHALIRPRAGDFVHSESELAAIRHDIEVAKALGAAGIVLGVLNTDATIDRDLTISLVALARPLRVTFHKAFDQTPDILGALDTLIALGVDRVLTSGGRRSAMEGVETLAKLVDRAGDQITVMVGGRLDFDNLETIIRQSGTREVHLGSAVTHTVHGSESSWDQTDPQRVAAVVSLVQSLRSSYR